MKIYRLFWVEEMQKPEATNDNDTDEGFDESGEIEDANNADDEDDEVRMRISAYFNCFDVSFW